MKYLKYFAASLTGIKKGVLPVWIGMNVMIAAIAVFAGYAGAIDPEKMPFSGIVAMTFPVWWIANVACLVINLILCRRLLPVPLAALIICIKPFLDFCPLNFRAPEITPEERLKEFKVLSYNTLSFNDQEPEKSSVYNRTMHTVLNSDADIVCLLEYENQGKLKKFMPQSQIDSLYMLYPYQAKEYMGTVAFSRTPILHISLPERRRSRGSVEAFRTLVDDKAILVFGVHMESIGLTTEDKSLYRRLTSMDVSKDEMSEVRSRLVSKLYDAYKNRAMQALFIKDYVEQMGGNVIVCGDFNDVPGCRALRILESAGLKDAYAELGLGPTITFNASHFFFRIDHVLYNGDFKAVKIERGNVPSSDHYPFLTTFVWNK